MDRAVRACFLAAAVAFLARAGPLFAGEDPPPDWAFPDRAAGVPRLADGPPRRVPGSSASFTPRQVRDPFFVADWHPQDHPPMPDIVARGRSPGVPACGHCHRADGSGTPENARLAGLTHEYIVQQLRDFRTGRRTSATPHRLPDAMMISLAKQLTEAEVEQAAAYFASIRPRTPAARVVEAERVPAVEAAGWMFARRAGEPEPIAGRIVELADDPARLASHDPRAPFTAFVPPGSLARGEALVAGRQPRKAMACSGCHGIDLAGQGPVPALAGRSPSYLMRQLYGFKVAARNGPNAWAMHDIVSLLGSRDLTDIAAYLASLATPP